MISVKYKRTFEYWSCFTPDHKHETKQEAQLCIKTNIPKIRQDIAVKEFNEKLKKEKTEKEAEFAMFYCEPKHHKYEYKYIVASKDAGETFKEIKSSCKVKNVSEAYYSAKAMISYFGSIDEWFKYDYYNANR
jgi:hypothetical protein